MQGTGLAGFLDCEDFAALILSTLLADAVRQLALVAIGTLRGTGWSEEVVAAAFGGTLLGVAAFRIRHCCSLSIGPRLLRYGLRRRLEGPVRLRFRANRV